LVDDERFQLLIGQEDVLGVAYYFGFHSVWQTLKEWVEEKACAVHAWQQNYLRWRGLHVIISEEGRLRRVILRWMD